MLGLAFAGMYFSERPSASVGSNLASQFSFSRHALPEVAGPEVRQARRLHPDLQHITGWWSSFGAAAALSDLDGDGLPNDACYVDMRTDQVIVAPVSGTGERYPPFALDFNRGGAKLYDRETMSPVGCLPGDFDEDGRIDILVYFYGRTPILLLSRATSTDIAALGARDFMPVDIIPGGQIWVTGSITSADLDGDGHLELIVANYQADGSALLDTRATSPIFMPASFTRAFNGGGLRIYRCLPKIGDAGRTVACSEVADAFPADLPKGWGLAVAASDIDGDLLPELYVANDMGPDHLLWNRSKPGHIRFDLVQGVHGLDRPLSRVVGRDSFKGMGVDFGDLNGDGVPDIFVSNITSLGLAQEGQLAFLSSAPIRGSLAKGIAPYVEMGEQLGLSRSGWAWDGKLDDFNNDGVLEAVQGMGFLKGAVSRWSELQELSIINDQLVELPKFWPVMLPGDDISGHERNAFFAKSGERYVDIAALIGFGEENPSRGIAIADIDGDGKLDMVVANIWGSSTYYHNTCSRCGNFLGLHLRLPVDMQSANTVVRDGHPAKNALGRPAIGATAVVTTADGRVLTRQVDGGNGHGGKRSPDLHFGIGSQTGPVNVSIKWRDISGQVQEATYQLNPGWHTLMLGSDGRPVPAM